MQYFRLLKIVVYQRFKFNGVLYFDWQFYLKQKPVILPSLLPVQSNFGVLINQVLGDGAKSSSVIDIRAWMAQTQRYGAKTLVSRPLAKKSYEARKTKN